MLKLKIQILILSFFLFANKSQAQQLQYENETTTENIQLTESEYDVSNINETHLYQTSALENPAAFLAGSWGVTFPVFGGERLDAEVTNGYELELGVQQLTDNLPKIGHVMTNLSYFAHSHYFTLRANANIDIAAEIHPDMVPSVANEQIMFNVLKKLKSEDKKIILYISTNYFDRGNKDIPNENGVDGIDKKWSAYIEAHFNDNTKYPTAEDKKYAAYKFLIQGFVEEVKDYADGYWLDTTDRLASGGYLEDFIAMIKGVDIDAAVSANYQKNYFVDENNNSIEVDSDGINDQDERDYKIILHEPLNATQDFTHGHVTPLRSGAPPNSWAYDEFTIPNMVKEPWYDYQGKQVLKHAWFPIRETWHNPVNSVLFNTEQAYRFVKKVIDGGAAITFANTISKKSNKGHIMADEMVIMKEINRRLELTDIPDVVPYSRPLGAFLVGEE